MKLAAVKLAEHLAAKNIKPSAFAAEIGEYPSTISRYLDGTNIPGIETALVIEQHTDGAIPIEDWVADHVKKKR